MDRNVTKWVMAMAAVVVAGVLVLGSVPAAAQGTQGKAGGDQVQSPKAHKSAKSSKAPKLAEGTKVNVNTATAEQLNALPKIGPKVAQRIVDYRTAHKGFRTVEELRNVKGVGPKVMEAIRPYLSL